MHFIVIWLGLRRKLSCQFIVYDHFKPVQLKVRESLTQSFSYLWHILFLLLILFDVLFRFLNRAMKSFDATVVVPTNFVLFTISAIISGKGNIHSNVCIYYKLLCRWSLWFFSALSCNCLKRLSQPLLCFCLHSGDNKLNCSKYAPKST